MQVPLRRAERRTKSKPNKNIKFPAGSNQEEEEEEKQRLCAKFQRSQQWHKTEPEERRRSEGTFAHQCNASMNASFVRVAPIVSYLFCCFSSFPEADQPQPLIGLHCDRGSTFCFVFVLKFRQMEINNANREIINHRVIAMALSTLSIVERPPATRTRCILYA